MDIQPDLKLAAQRARVLLQDEFLAWITILMLLSTHWSAILVHLNPSTPRNGSEPNQPTANL
jgi:hypothetical protein